VPNGRSKENPYSLRQLGVCQRFCVATGRSHWIVLSPSEDLRDQLKERFKTAKCRGVQCQNPLLPHHIFLSCATSAWDDFIEHLRQRLEQYVSHIRSFPETRSRRLKHSRKRRLISHASDAKSNLRSMIIQLRLAIARSSNCSRGNLCIGRLPSQLTWIY
jgi:hypothetical protein